VRTKIQPRAKPLGPEVSPEAKLEQAKNAHAALQHSAQEIRDGRQSMFKAFAELIGKPNEEDRVQLIWAGLVRFANETLDGRALSMETLLALRATIALCVLGNQDLEDVQGEVFTLGFFEDVYRLQTAKKISVDDAFSILAVDLHPRLRLLLAWIADPNRMSHDDRQAALSFLLEHGEQEMAQYEFDPNEEFDETGNVGYPIFYWKRPRSFETVMVPVARFIFERLEQYNDGDIALDDAIPIVLCRREGCGKFSISQRRTKDFCSASCRSLNRQKEKPEEHAEYMRQYRKNNYTKPFPRKKRTEVK